MTDLRRGSRGTPVTLLQTNLNALGAGIAVDGVFGPETEQAVRNFQSSAGLKVDGIAGPETSGVLAAHIANGRDAARAGGGDTPAVEPEPAGWSTGAKVGLAGALGFVAWLLT